MNKQSPGIEWTRVWGRPGYTWNPVAGCRHGCRWEMPEGEVVRCYAEAIAEGLARRAFPQGFGHHYWYPERLEAPKRLETPAGIFLDSMSDLLGAWVPDWQVAEVLEVCQATPQHVYFLLTKNPGRLERLTVPRNVWVGVSSPPHWMNGRRLTARQRRRWMQKALTSLQNARGAVVRWVSFEPLTDDWADLLEEWAPDWAVLGAGSAGRQVHAPRQETVVRLAATLRRKGTAIFWKRNLRAAAEAWGLRWTASFPDEGLVQALARANEGIGWGVESRK